VFDERLNISIHDVDLHDQAEVAFLNSKGFGGNNATAAVLSNRVAESMLKKRYTKAQISAYRDKRESVIEAANSYDDACMRGPMKPIYRFGEAMIDAEKIEINASEIRLPGIARSVNLELKNPYDDMV
jgi:acetoacetyl-[acyl-carrier protein] synthase